MSVAEEVEEMFLWSAIKANNFFAVETNFVSPRTICF